MNPLLFAFGLTLLAGLSTGIGSAIAFLTNKTNKRFLSLSLGFSAGVMIYVSMVEIFPDAKEALTLALGEKMGSWLTVIGFFFGIFLIAMIDKFVPEVENPHMVHSVEEMDGNDDYDRAHLMRMGLLTAIAVAVHNFPEGLATFTSALGDPHVGIPIAVAVALHNIPEGIAISVPVYYATGDRLKAFRLSFLSGLSEPLGALLGYILLHRYFNDTMFGMILAAVAGIMIYISLDELLPSAREYGEHHLSIYGLIAGMAVMAISLLMFI